MSGDFGRMGHADTILDTLRDHGGTAPVIRKTVTRRHTAGSDDEEIVPPPAESTYESRQGISAGLLKRAEETGLVVRDGDQVKLNPQHPQSMDVMSLLTERLDLPETDVKALIADDRILINGHVLALPSYMAAADVGDAPTVEVRDAGWRRLVPIHGSNRPPYLRLREAEAIIAAVEAAPFNHVASSGAAALRAHIDALGPDPAVRPDE